MNPYFHKEYVLRQNRALALDSFTVLLYPLFLSRWGDAVQMLKPAVNVPVVERSKLTALLVSLVLVSGEDPKAVAHHSTALPSWHSQSSAACGNCWSGKGIPLGVSVGVSAAS